MSGDRTDFYDRYRIDKVHRAGKILKIVAQAKEPMTVAQIQEAAELTPDMCFRTCITLEEMGFLDFIGDAYQLGSGLSLFWARKKAMLEERRKRIDRELELLGEE